GQLRDRLRIDTSTLLTSATIDKECTKYTIKYASIRKEGLNPYETKIIRSSIDRPEIIYIIKFIPREYLTDYDMLYIVIDNAVSYPPIPNREEKEVTKGLVTL
ncbi:uncharacterized protein MYCFIDRAFT_146178, partial [Pseudocercospora fijiensis CIRAD86]